MRERARESISPAMVAVLHDAQALLGLRHGDLGNADTLDGGC